MPPACLPPAQPRRRKRMPMRCYDVLVRLCRQCMVQCAATRPSVRCLPPAVRAATAAYLSTADDVQRTSLFASADLPGRRTCLVALVVRAVMSPLVVLQVPTKPPRLTSSLHGATPTNSSSERHRNWPMSHRIVSRGAYKLRGSVQIQVKQCNAARCLLSLATLNDRGHKSSPHVDTSVM
jgi:hypothetical protein